MEEHGNIIPLKEEVSGISVAFNKLIISFIFDKVHQIYCFCCPGAIPPHCFGLQVFSEVHSKTSRWEALWVQTS